MRRTLAVLVCCFGALACSGDDGGGGGDTLAFCASLEELGSGDLLASLEPSDPSTVEGALGELEDLQTQAPREIEAEVTVVAESLEQVSSALEEGGGDIGAVLEQVDDLENLREVQEAAERITAFSQEECGVAAGGS